MKPFAERSYLTIGAVGIVTVVGIVLAALNYQKLPFLNPGRDYTAYFADAGGLLSGASVEVSGYATGKVSDIEVEGDRVLVSFRINGDVRLGDRTEAAVKTKSLLGTKVLEVIPLGGGELDGTIPLERTVSPYQLADSLGDLAITVSGLDTNQLSDSLSTLSQTFSGTAPDLKEAVEGVARFSESLNDRDAQLRNLLDNAAKATTVLAKRSEQIAGLVANTNALLAQLRTQSAALDNIWNNISAVSHQLQAFIAENRQQLKPALDKLNGVLTIVDDRKVQVQESIKLLNNYAMSLGEALSSGPFFKAYVSNILPGQFVQPFVDAAFSDLGLDPATLLPSQLTDPQTGQPGTPALPSPYPRTGQGGEPQLNLPDAITGKPGDPRYPYREPLPAPPPGGPPPGPPADLQPAPMPSPVYVPAPGEISPATHGEQP